jgi:phosphoketolase
MPTEPSSRDTSALSPAELEKVDKLWRAAKYLSVGQIYLLDNPLLKKPLAREHIKPRLLGHWGTTPGLNFLYAHLNRAINRRGVFAEATRSQGKYLRDVMRLNLEKKSFRLFSPDENNSNRWQDVLEVTNRCYMARIPPEDDHLSPDGRVMEVLSEHQCQGWLEGYLLTGRHGFFSCYKEDGTTTTPFDMVVLNEPDRFHLAQDVVDRRPQLGARAAYFRQGIRDRLIEHKQYIETYGEDMPGITGWRWDPSQKAGRTNGGVRSAATSTESDNV